MPPVIKIPEHCFQKKLSFKDYKVHRWSFGGAAMITIEDTRNGQEYEMDPDFVNEMRYALMELTPHLGRMPNDEDILIYCVLSAEIPHPYEEYV